MPIFYIFNPLSVKYIKLNVSLDIFFAEYFILVLFLLVINMDTFDLLMERVAFSV